MNLMTVKDIARAVGRNPSTVARWVDKASLKMQEVARKVAAAKSSQDPAQYNLDEVCAIIQAGLGANAAGIFRANALGQPSGAHDQGLARIDRLEGLVEQLVGLFARAASFMAPGQPSGAFASPPRALPPPADLMPRDALRQIVDGWARAHGGAYHEAWAGLYREYGYRYHRDLGRCAKARGMTVLDYADSEDSLGELLALAYFLYGRQEAVS